MQFVDAIKANPDELVEANEQDEGKHRGDTFQAKKGRIVRPFW